MLDCLAAGYLCASTFDRRFAPVFAVGDGPSAGLDAVKVLIVDDELFVALDIEQLVEDLGCECAGIARNATQAISLAVELQPDLILMDLNLGSGMNGAEAAKVILLQVSCRIIFITAYRDAAHLSQMKAVAPEAVVLSKPVAVASLVSAMRG